MFYGAFVLFFGKQPPNSLSGQQCEKQQDVEDGGMLVVLFYFRFNCWLATGFLNIFGLCVSTAREKVSGEEVCNPFLF